MLASHRAEAEARNILDESISIAVDAALANGESNHEEATRDA